MKLALGLMLAGLAAGAFVVGYVGQHRALSTTTPLSVRRPLVSLAFLVRSPTWLAAYAAGIVGWGFYVSALACAPLAVVQAVSGAIFGLLAIISIRSKQAIHRAERIGVLFSLVGLLLVVAVAGGSARDTRPSPVLVATFVAFVLALALGGIAIAPRSGLGIALGVGSGLSYGIGDVATKAVVLGDAVVIPLALVAIGLGFTTLQLSYQRASLLNSAGLSALFTNSIPIVLGLALFHERVGGTRGAIDATGFALVVVGSILLARS